MPLLKGKENIGHNIEVEQEHGKPHKQAVAIALRTAGVPKKGKDMRSVDNIAPVGTADPERAAALVKHNQGITKSQDRRARDTSVSELEAELRRVQEMIRRKFGQGEPTYALEMRRKQIEEQLRLAEIKPVGGVQDELSVPVKPTTLVPMPSGERNEQLYAPRPVDGLREEVAAREEEWKKDKAKKGAEFNKTVSEAQQRLAGGKGKDVLRNSCTHFKAERGGINCKRCHRPKSAHHAARAADASSVTAPTGTNIRKNEHDEYEVKLAEWGWNHAGVYYTNDKEDAIGTAKAMREHVDKNKTGDVLRNSCARFKGKPGSINCARCSRPRSAHHVATRDANHQGALVDHKAFPSSKDPKLCGQCGYACSNPEMHTNADSYGGPAYKAKANDAAQHMQEAVSQEIAGEQVIAAICYRAAERAYVRAGDTVNAARARDGISACQAGFDAHYEHPGRGYTKVCDSPEAAVRTALERTRAGERVRITDGVVVRPAEDDNADVTRFNADVKKFTEQGYSKEQAERLAEKAHQQRLKTAYETKHGPVKKWTPGSPKGEPTGGKGTDKELQPV